MVLLRIPLCVLLIATGSSVIAYATTVEQMQAMVDNRQCPRNPATYSLREAHKECSGSSAEMMKCQAEIGRDNRTIAEFNKFVLQCRQSLERGTIVSDEPLVRPGAIGPAK